MLWHLIWYLQSKFLLMKTNLKITAFSAAIFLSFSTRAQSDSLGLAGDNLDLNAVLSIFKQSSTVEDFEKRLNAADSKVNNLDLNNDQKVDYLRVVDSGKDDFHSIIIQDPVSKTESQDVAVIEIQKKDNQTAHIQIVGDETLYGKNYIIEPHDQAQSVTDKNANVDDVYASPGSGTGNVMINVWAWPSVGYIYSPGYNYWVSPWYWGYYPGWYTPWNPYGYYFYRRNFINYNYGFYGWHCHHYAFQSGHNYYYGYRTTSGYVQKTAPRSGGNDGNMRNGRMNGNQQRGGTNRNGTDQPRNRIENNQGQNRGNSGSPNRIERGQPQNNPNQGRNQSQRMDNSPRINPSGGMRNGGGGSIRGGGGGNVGGGGRRR